MTTTLDQLLADLDAAVRAGAIAWALKLAKQIEQQLAAEPEERARVEREVRALLARLNLRQPHPNKNGASEGRWGLVRERKENRRTVQQAIGAPRKGSWHAAPPTSYKSTQGAESLATVTRDGLKPGGSEPTNGVVYPVWFGTNRRPDGRGGYTSERHAQTTLGRVLVHVPQAHRFGEIGNSFWQRLLRFDLRDDRLRVQEVATRGPDDFFAEVGEALAAAAASGDQPQALVYLHGYNTSFDEAAIRAAQIGFDLKVPGATAFFSWPSRGTVAAYPADEATIEASEGAIARFLKDFAAGCGNAKVNVIAHSMGNRGLLRALQRIAADAETRGGLTLGQVFLAAPDIDRGLFLDLAHLYPRFCERTTLYASDADLAVHASARLHDAPRAGYFRPYSVAPGIDTVAVPDFNLDLLGHGYFAQAEALLHDLFDLVRHGHPPERRQRLEPAFEDGVAFWQLRR
jgi:esterase/lipase superfamily enzyme